MPQIPFATRILLILYGVLSIGRAVLANWARVVDLQAWLALEPGAVLRGQVWRLITNPWFSRPFLDSQGLGLLWGGFVLYFVSRELERAWGPRVFLRRVVLLVAVPSAVTVLLALLVPSIQSHAYFGLTPLITALFVAYATTMRGREVRLMLLPIPLSGDRLIAVTGLFLFLEVLLNGAILPFMPEVFSFGLALAWFRFDVVRDARHALLRAKKRRVEAKVEKLRKQRNLRVVPPDDDEGSHYLH